MTIIEPNKNKFRFNAFIVFIAGLLILEAILGVIAYSRSVHFTYLLEGQKKSIEDLRVQNADLKNRLYTILDFQNVDQLAEQFGLIKERKPDFLVRQ